MRLPVLAATVERRLLVNYRVDAELVARLLPAGPRPQVLGGAAVAGICLTRLARVRPGGLPGQVGIRTENAAHRIAVCWDDPAGGPPRAGVFIPLRHTSSRAGALLGGRLFPGLHHRARFAVQESARQVSIAVTAPDGTIGPGRRGHPGEGLAGQCPLHGPGRGVGLLPHGIDGLLTRQRPAAPRRYRAAHPELDGEASRDHPCPVELLRRPAAVPTRQRAPRRRAPDDRPPRHLARPARLLHTARMTRPGRCGLRRPPTMRSQPAPRQRPGLRATAPALAAVRRKGSGGRISPVRPVR